ncbi:DUF333 domain-containing protein [Pantoea agglomerans]|nr:DUF333 domain-containing protein [Pantoea agglomerans]NEH05291.1 DUF333 domain-containing protein [Pantoea agglomerans]
MRVVNRITVCSLMLAALQISACAPHHAEPQRLTMRNPASEWCVQRGGQEVKEASLNGSRLYCLLPTGEKIEQWALFHRDHPQ